MILSSRSQHPPLGQGVVVISCMSKNSIGEMWLERVLMSSVFSEPSLIIVTMPSPSWRQSDLTPIRYIVTSA